MQQDDEAGQSVHIPMKTRSVWLRVDCDFMSEVANFSYSTDGKNFKSIGSPFTMVYSGITFQGVRYSLFNYGRTDASGTSTAGGFADFDSYSVSDLSSHGQARPIQYGKTISLRLHGQSNIRYLEASGRSLVTGKDPGEFLAVDQGLGRVSLKSKAGFLSVDEKGGVTVQNAIPGIAETFQWIDTFTGELTLLSLKTNRYLHVDRGPQTISADNIGPSPDDSDGVRFDWTADSAPIVEPSALGAAPYGKEIELAGFGQESSRRIANSTNSLYAGLKNTISFMVVNYGRGRVAHRP